MKEIEYIIDACETKLEVLCALATVLGIGIMTALVLLTVNTWFGILYAFAFPWLLKAGVTLVKVIDKKNSLEDVIKRNRKYTDAWEGGYHAAIDDCKEAKENGEEWPNEELDNE